MARGRRSRHRRLSLERLGVLPHRRLRQALGPLLSAADVAIGVAIVLGVVALLNHRVVAAVVRGRRGPPDGARLLGGTLAVVASLTVLAATLLVRARRRAPRSSRPLLVFALCCLACVAIAKGLLALDARVVPRWRNLVYLTPLSGFAILFTVVYGRRAAVAVSAFLALLIGLAVHVGRPAGVGAARPLCVVVVLLCGAVVATVVSERIRTRVRLVIIGLTVSLIHVGMLVGFDLMAGTLQLEPFAPPEILWGVLNGLAVGVVTTISLPFVEMFFSVATDIQLLELSDQEQPLLRSLVALAPSTDNHSRRVALLADAAAEAIGANAPVARVGAYYHDIGKMLKPDYYIENIGDAESPHDHLNPTLSTLIIAAHTKDGVELAREAKLPPPIIDIIEQHHGTSVIEFFYSRHLEDAGATGHLDRHFFRYAGPKPQTREAAIVMLADIVEAASRTLKQPLPARLRKLIGRLIAGRLQDGQLDDCDLTVSQLHRIADAFFRVLCAMFHARIEYPGQPADG